MAKQDFSELITYLSSRIKQLSAKIGNKFELLREIASTEESPKRQR